MNNDINEQSRRKHSEIEIENDNFSLNQCLTTTINLVKPRAYSKGVTLSCDVSYDVNNDLVGDAGWLQQVLLNLLGNAIKFTRVGRVSLSIVRHPDDPGGSTLQFSVTDSGIGIAPERVSGLFAQADSATTGRFADAGLGLPISRQLVELMGGRISCVSVLDQGSVFSFTLPFAIQNASARPSPGAPTVAPAPLRILMVEDSADNRAVTLAYLKDTPYRTDVADTGAIACEMFATGDYDLVLMDRQMPVMDGLTATRAMRAWETVNGRRPAPIIALTASTLKGDREICITAGCTAYLSKPVKQRVLLRAIADHSHWASLALRPTPPSSRVRRRAARGASSTEAPRTVLIVDCLRRNISMMRALLDEGEFRLLSVGDVAGALRLVHRERPDLIVANTHLREEEGSDLLRAIRADSTLPAIPFVFVTASTLRSSDKAMAEEFGAGIMSPDSDPSELRRRILAWLPPRSQSLMTDQLSKGQQSPPSMTRPLPAHMA